VTSWLNSPTQEGGGDLVPRSFTALYTVPDYTQFQCNITDIEYAPDKDAQRDPSLVEEIHKKIDQEGLRWPIILKASENNKYKYKCYIGNNRVAYASNHGYNDITAIVVTSSADKLHIMQYCKRIDEHGFDSE